MAYPMFKELYRSILIRIYKRRQIKFLMKEWDWKREYATQWAHDHVTYNWVMRRKAYEAHGHNDD